MLLNLYLFMRVTIPKEILWKTTVGSHMWRMDRPDSDVDYFIAYAYPTKWLLRGHSPKLSGFKSTKEVDVHDHEIGKIISQLKKNNVNFILGVMSPIVNDSCWVLDRLREVLMENPPREIYQSVRGMALANYRKYIEHCQCDTSDRMDKIARVVQFATTLLKCGEYRFEPTVAVTRKELLDMMKELDAAYMHPGPNVVKSLPVVELGDILEEVRIELLDMDVRELEKEWL